MSRCCIALGGNTGDPELSFAEALTQIEHYGVQVLQTSSSILTPAMGSSAGSDFLNAAAILDTNLDASDVLQLLHHIEAGFGRKRSVHWGPRVIDLDLLFFEQQILDTDEIVIPHPCLWYRRFVLEPLNQIAPDWIHPTLNESVAKLHSRLNDRPLHLEIVSTDRISVEALQSIAETVWGRGQLKFSLAEDNTTASQNTFARLVEEPSSVRAQPTLEHSRVIRVPRNCPDGKQNDTTALWTELLKDFGTAALS